jgi:predicted neutral ceramidase superfamily lipid hydrolase
MFFPILFIISTLYFILNYSHLEDGIEGKLKRYSSKTFILVDILYYVIELIYPFWVIILLFSNYKFSLFFISIWILISIIRYKYKRIHFIEMIYSSIKILGLITITYPSF